jgi:hypothetical protein
LATFSETFPRWGSMHDGQVFAHPTPERVTEESASSSLHTPTTGDTAPTYDHRASPGYTRAIPVPNLAAQVDELLPTPEGSDASGGRRSKELGGTRPSGAKRAITLATRLDHLLPSPGAWLGRRPENSLPDPERAASKKHAGKRGKRSVELPDAIASIGDHTDPPSEDTKP